MDVKTEAIVILTILGVIWGWMVYVIHKEEPIDNDFDITITKEDIDLKNKYED